MKFRLALFVVSLFLSASARNHCFIEVGGDIGFSPSLNYEWMKEIKSSKHLGMRVGISVLPYNYYDSQKGYALGGLYSIQSLMGRWERIKLELNGGYGMTFLRATSTHDRTISENLTQAVHVGVGSRWILGNGHLILRAIFQPTMIISTLMRDSEDMKWREYRSLDIISWSNLKWIPLPWGALSIGYGF